MIIRKAHHQDIAQIARIAQEVYVATFGDEMTHSDLQSALESRNEQYFSDAIETEKILVAENNDTIVGFIQFGDVSYDSLETKPEDLELNKIYVDVNSHGQGIGKMLMEAMLENERVAATTDIYLDVYARNDKATGLYKKYGFVEIGKVPFEVDGRVVGYDVLMKRTHQS